MTILARSVRTALGGHRFLLLAPIAVEVLLRAGHGPTPATQDASTALRLYAAVPVSLALSTRIFETDRKPGRAAPQAGPVGRHLQSLGRAVSLSWLVRMVATVAALVPGGGYSASRALDLLLTGITLDGLLVVACGTLHTAFGPGGALLALLLVPHGGGLASAATSHRSWRAVGQTIAVVAAQAAIWLGLALVVLTVRERRRAQVIRLQGFTRRGEPPPPEGRRRLSSRWPGSPLPPRDAEAP